MNFLNKPHFAGDQSFHLTAPQYPCRVIEVIE